MRNKLVIGNPNIMIGLKRASWLFCLIVGFIAMSILASDYGLDEPEDYLPGSIIATIVGFILFRIGIWVYKGFIGYGKIENE